MIKKTVFLVAFLCSGIVCFAENWPQWRGLNRDGASAETGLLKTWPAEGPSVLWKVPIGSAYSSMAISGQTLYTMDSHIKNENVVAIDIATGKEKWRAKSDSNYTSGQGDGPRSTPTVDGNMVYALGAQGMLVALNANTGQTVWSHNIRQEFEAEVPQWGISGSPIVEGDLLLVEVGGKPDHSIIAFHKKNGTIV